MPIVSASPLVLSLIMYHWPLTPVTPKITPGDPPDAPPTTACKRACDVVFVLSAWVTVSVLAVPAAEASAVVRAALPLIVLAEENMATWLAEPDPVIGALPDDAPGTP